MGLRVRYRHRETGDVYPDAYVRLHSVALNTVIVREERSKDGTEVTPAKGGFRTAVATFYVYADQATRAAWGEPLTTQRVRCRLGALDLDVALMPQFWALLKQRKGFDTGTDV